MERPMYGLGGCVANFRSRDDTSSGDDDGYKPPDTDSISQRYEAVVEAEVWESLLLNRFDT